MQRSGEHRGGGHAVAEDDIAREQVEQVHVAQLGGNVHNVVLLRHLPVGRWQHTRGESRMVDAPAAPQKTGREAAGQVASVCTYRREHTPTHTLTNLHAHREVCSAISGLGQVLGSDPEGLTGGLPQLNNVQLGTRVLHAHAHARIQSNNTSGTGDTTVRVHGQLQAVGD